MGKLRGKLVGKLGGKPGGELLLEIGVEEVPAFLVRSTLDQLRDRATELFALARLEAREVRSYGTPRRLVLSAVLPNRQQELVMEVTGPPRAAAYDAGGNPTAAAVGFAASQGVKVTDLQIVKTGKGDYVAVRVTQPALPTATVLKQLLPTLVGQLQFPKTMHWHESGQRFIRPLRGLVALFDRQVIPLSFADVTSGRRTVGHRALSPGAVTISRAADYSSRLRRACVLVDDEERRSAIVQGVRDRARALGASLLDEETVTMQAVYSSEWPVVAEGGFDRAYLDLPKELLVAVLEHQQGYFGLQQHGKLLSRFLCVVDGGARQQASTRLATMVRGHERVLRARLEDARFYVKQDLAVTLSDRVATLKGVTFHEKLGSLHEKTMRVVELARWLAPQLGVEVKEAGQAARLCKADLVTGLVREFPELQGVIGGDYAARHGESPTVAAAIAEQYRPRFTGDALPASSLGQLLSLADKVDTIVGYFGVGLAPTGSEDPYALRRQAAGIVQIAMLHPALDLFGLIKQANGGYKGGKGKWQDNTIQLVHAFLAQRLEWQLLSEGYKSDLVAAVLAGPWKYPAKVKRFLTALQSVISTSVGDDLLTVYRRVGRIVPAGFNPGDVNKDLLTEPELALYKAYLPLERFDVQGAIDKENEHEILKELAQLRPVVDEFFTKVMVMDNDLTLRNNRLQLVYKVSNTFRRVADFSKISTASSSPAAAQAGRVREV
jgi:glycyl-tRNA synthetase beta chain